MATTVEVLAEAFVEAGTPFIVGHPGGESAELVALATAALSDRTTLVAVRFDPSGYVDQFNALREL